MSNETRVFDLDQLTMTFGNILLDDGFADGETCTIVRDAESFTAVVGSDGSVTRSKTRNKLTTVTIKLMQSSPLNEQLSALLELDENTPGGAGVGSLLVRDRQSGLTQSHLPKAWIVKPPDQSFDRTATAREWQFKGIGNIKIGGNIAPVGSGG